MRPAFEDLSEIDHIKPNASDWEAIELARSLLEPFRFFTELLSGSQYPTISLVIPAYHTLMRRLANITLGIEGANQFSAEQRSAAAFALDKLCKYYLPPGYTSVYAVATAMDLRARAWWWSTLNWSPDAVSSAKAAVEMAWINFKPSMSAVNPLATQAFIPVYGTPSSSSTTGDELNRYMQETVIEDFEKFDQLRWWQLAQVSSPNLLEWQEDIFPFALLPHLRNDAFHKPSCSIRT